MYKYAYFFKLPKSDQYFFLIKSGKLTVTSSCFVVVGLVVLDIKLIFFLVMLHLLHSLKSNLLFKEQQQQQQQQKEQVKFHVEKRVQQQERLLNKTKI